MGNLKAQIMLNPQNEIHLDLNGTLEQKNITTYEELRTYLWKNFHIDIDIDSESDYFEHLFYNSDLRSQMGFMFPEFGMFVVFPKFYIDKDPSSKWSKMWRQLIREATILDENFKETQKEEKSLISRKFKIGQIVQTKAGIKAKVIGSALYGIVNGKPTPFAWVEYRLLSEGSKRSFYRREDQLKEVNK